METLTENKTGTREISISRILNAPRELVWEVWTDPKHIVKWWGPTGFSNTIKVMDVRPGGDWIHTMHGPDGKDYPNETAYTEVVKPERLSYKHVSPSFDATVTLENLGDKTKLTMTMVFATVEEYNFVVKEHGAIEGQKQTISRLEEHLSGMIEGNELVITRTFNAPRELVYKAFSEAEALAQWWAPKGSEIHVKTLEFKPGGVFHYSMQSAQMGEMWGKFKYLEMVEPERIVFINCFSNKDGNISPSPFLPDSPLEIMNILTLTGQEGKTILTLRGGPINATKKEQEVFNNMRNNMLGGFKGTLDQLEEYLAKNHN